jgi:hypothetical protein
MPNKSENLRREADAENKAARKSKSLRESGGHRRRGQALNDMADNEDWLAGKPKPTAKDD